jgi:hypothetical protein
VASAAALRNSISSPFPPDQHEPTNASVEVAIGIVECRWRPPTRRRLVVVPK